MLGIFEWVNRVHLLAEDAAHDVRLEIKDARRKVFDGVRHQALEKRRIMNEKVGKGARTLPELLFQH